MGVGQVEHAIKMARKAHAMDPADHQMALYRATLHVEASEHDVASELVAQVLGATPEDHPLRPLATCLKGVSMRPRNAATATELIHQACEDHGVDYCCQHMPKKPPTPAP